MFSFAVSWLEELQASRSLRPDRRVRRSHRRLVELLWRRCCGRASAGGQ
jgi:hypothetical protein